MTRLGPAFLLLALPLTGAGFRAAAVKVDITPQSPSGYAARQSTGVHDNIYRRVLALDSGDAQFYLVSSDLCLFSPSLYDSVAAELQKSGIQRLQFWWSVTHTHAAPEIGAPDIYKALLGRSDHDWDREYTARVTGALVDAVRSRAKLEPARITSVRAGPRRPSVGARARRRGVTR